MQDKPPYWPPDILSQLFWNSGLFILAFMSFTAYSFTWQGGVSILDEGDDRRHYGTVASIGMNQYDGKLYYFNRTFGPAQQITSQFSFSKNFPLPILKRLEALTGVAFLSEATKIKYLTTSLSAYNKKDNQTNFGLFLGLRWWIIEPQKTFIASITWDTAIYPAGLSGGLFLATGRKQILSLNMGFKL